MQATEEVLTAEERTALAKEERRADRLRRETSVWQDVEALPGVQGPVRDKLTYVPTTVADEAGNEKIIPRARLTAEADLDDGRTVKADAAGAWALQRLLLARVKKALGLREPEPATGEDRQLAQAVGAKRAWVRWSPEAERLEGTAELEDGKRLKAQAESTADLEDALRRRVEEYRASGE